MSNISQEENSNIPFFIVISILLIVVVGFVFKGKNNNYGGNNNNDIPSRQQVYQPRTTTVDMYPRRDANGEPTNGKVNGSYYR